MYCIVVTEDNCPVKVGIAEDTVLRLSCLQAANFSLLRIHRFWWLPGRPVAERAERHFKEHFQLRCVRGEWFDLGLPEVEAFIEGAIRNLGTWGVSGADVIEYMAHRARQ